MVSAVGSIGQTPISTESLEIIRRLQSLGVAPTGNLSIDKQHLQQAELQKKQETMASNSIQNLSSLNGTGNDFSSTLNNLNISQSAQIDNLSGVQPQDKTLSSVIRAHMVLGTESGNNTQLANLSGSAMGENAQFSPDKMIGATQLAELNKFKLGLIA